MYTLVINTTKRKQSQYVKTYLEKGSYKNKISEKKICNCLPFVREARRSPEATGAVEAVN